MKYLKLLWCLIVAAFACPDSFCESAVEIEPSRYSFNDLLDAIAEVESGGDPNAYNEAEDAVGLFQIRKIYVDDVNRILGRNVFCYADRLDPDESRMMVAVYLGRYGVCRPIEALARIHNGGPRGWKKKSTIPYWEKVKKELDKGVK